MQVLPELLEALPELTQWRRDIHQHPELAFEERRTSDLVAERLASWGIEVHRGLATTGVVGVLEGERAPAEGAAKAIGLRADMDALPMQEHNDIPHRSVNEGVFHGCGHDGHTTMLLAAARHLSQHRDFAGSVRFIFQPAEEGQGGGRVMVEDGLFDSFPCDWVFGMHNWPDLPAGQVAVRPGPIMAASDTWDLEIVGKGSHAAFPHQSVDPVVIGAQIVAAFQQLVSRNVAPQDSAVVSVTQFHAGTAYNVIPGMAKLGGTARTLQPATQDAIEAGMKRIAESIAAAHGATASLDYRRGYPATINDEAGAAHAAAAAASVVGGDAVLGDVPPTMGGEDFSFMLQAVPGAYLWLGQGGGPSACTGSLHNPHYDFNDEVLPIGASIHVALVQRLLG